MGQAKRIQAAPPPSPYEADFYLWCFEQAENLRQGRFATADLPNIIEELESMGRSDRRALRSSYRLVLQHLLKWQFQPDKRTPSWETTIDRESDVIEETEAESPSLRSQSVGLVRTIYPKARRDAAKETGLPLSSFPPDCPYSLDQVRDPDWLPAGGSDRTEAPGRAIGAGRRPIRRSQK
jgi:hypothetical protein